MKAMLPVYCRPLGYTILAVSVFLPFLFLIWGVINDYNLLFYKECIKLLMMTGALMILLALSKNESFETEQIRIKATRNAVFFTFFFIFFSMLYRLAVRDIQHFDTASFVVFLIINVICLEFEMKRYTINKAFKE